MKNDASLLNILEWLPGQRAEFEHTKPSEATPADDIAMLFEAFGVQTLRASLVELGSMRCTHTWHITEAGAMVEDVIDKESDRALPTAMATIVKLSLAGPEHTQSRELDPFCWAFAWGVEERHVAVVEAQYRSARSAHSDADAVLMRQVCGVGVRTALASAGGATPDADPCLASPSAVPARRDGQPAGAKVRSRTSSPLPVVSTGRQRGTSSWLGLSQSVALAVLALGLATAGLVVALLQSATALQTASAQVQAKADATVKELVGKALAEGDYGEVQAELATFESLKYFDSALVTNARGRVIAAAGPVQGVRMGDPLAADVAASARVIELSNSATRIGQLLVWERAVTRAPGLAGKSLTTKALLIAVVAAAIAAVVLLQLWRRQRRDTADH